MSSIYQNLGVSADKEEVHAAVKDQDQGVAPGAFCHVQLDPAGGGRLAVLHSDGAGSKALVAWLLWKQTGQLEVFRSLAQDAAVMNLDDIACVGATDGFLVSNTVGRNARLVGGDVLQVLVAGYADFMALMAKQGVRVLLCGGETADMPDQVRTLTVDCTAYASMAAEQLISFAQVQAGDAIVGLASDGQCAWEQQGNSGIGCNGLTLARHLLLSPDNWSDWPEAAPSYAVEKPVENSVGNAAENPSENAVENKEHRGRFMLADELPGGDMTIAQALLSPTRPYVSVIHRLMQMAVPLHGLVHCSGGGQTKCLHFGQSLHYVKHSLFAPPPLFRLLAEEGQVPPQEMYRVFNMGHRMEIYCPPDAVAAICTEAERVGIRAQQVGEVLGAAAGQNHLSIHTHDGDELHYGS